MYKIISKSFLNPTVVRMDIEAPLVALKAEAGQFVILRVDNDGERIPLTIADYDRARGSVSIIFQIVGFTTHALSLMEVGDELCDFAGPLGRPTDTENIKDALIIGGGVGCAIALPVAKKLKEQGARVRAVIGFRSKDLVILQDEFSDACEEVILVTDDGTAGEKGNVCAPLKRILSSDDRPSKIFAIGPLVMMKYVVMEARPTGIPCDVSMNPVMIDGTGMCGGCRLTLNVDGKKLTKFACVDGPDFNGYEVDFDEAMRRNAMYRDYEHHRYSSDCNLFKEGKK